MKYVLFFVSLFVLSGLCQELKCISGGHKFPEGPAWDGSRCLYVSNCYGDWITRILHKSVDTLVVKPSLPVNFGKTNGLTVFKNGNIYACDYGLGAIVYFSPAGICSMYIAGYNGVQFNRPNDLAFDPAGNLYFSDPKSYDKNNRDGRLFVHFRNTNQTVLISDNLAFPNGIAFSADAKKLFISESALNRVIKFDVKRDGTLGDSEIFINLPGGDPDGIALDTKGNVFVAHFGTGTVFVVSSKGTIIEEITMPGKKPTNLEFGGEDMRILYITEAETNSVYTLKVSQPGLRLFSAP
jgi:gluconolactonase